MRTLLMSLSILAGATMAAASPAGAAPHAPAALAQPVAQSLVAAPGEALVQTVQWHDGRRGQWRRHEAERWRRHEAWRHRGYGYGYGHGRPWGGPPPGRAYGYYRGW